MINQWKLKSEIADSVDCFVNPCHTENFNALYALLPNFYSVNMQHPSWKHVFSECKTVWILIRWVLMKPADPDQMASDEASWSGSTMFSKSDKFRLSRTIISGRQLLINSSTFQYPADVKTILLGRKFHLHYVQLSSWLDPLWLKNKKTIEGQSM